MIHADHQHHEATLPLLQQLLLTGSLVVPLARAAVLAAKAKRSRTKKSPREQ